MTAISPIGRKWMFFTLFATVMTNAAGDCPSIILRPPPIIPPPVVDFVEIELINDAFDPVDPGLFVDGDEFIVDPPLDPEEVVTLEFDCFVGTTFETDATLLTAFGFIASDNVPFVEEGFEFLCGDTVSFVFVDDGEFFFTEVYVNGELIID